MCGIAAIIEMQGGSPDRTSLKRMTDSIIHRGPDDEGMYIDGVVGLGFRRLAIIDLSTDSHQPMESSDGKLVIIFNGEIYNYIELRDELLGLGHTFKTRGDTEVLLHAYQQWGKDCLEKLNGMWAFLIYDRRRKLLFGARDRFGEKPLYYYKCADRFLFASEIKAIRASGYYKGAIHWPTAASFLLSGSLNDSTHSFYEGIEEVPAGSMFELKLSGEQIWRRYWNLADIEPESFENPIDTYANVFQEAVKLRMRSDVPVGVCLSGGLDSTGIICEMARIAASKVQAFSYIDEEFDESLYIKDTMAQTGAVLNRVDMENLDLWASLQNVLKVHDEPVHSINVVIGFELMRLAASKGIKVVLNGQGSDETSGGYSSYFLEYWVSLLKDMKLAKVWQEVRQYSAGHRIPNLRLWKQAVLRAVATTIAPWPIYRQFKQLGFHKRRPHFDWFDQGFVETHNPFNKVIAPRSLTEVLRHAVESDPLPLYLRIEDRNSMGNSIESRLPFLDYRLVSFLFKISDHYKLCGQWNKHIQREALKGRIPETVRMRVDKMGFPVPLKRWMAGSFHEPVADLLSSRACRERGIYNYAALYRDLDRYRRGEVDASLTLFFVAQFEEWASLQ